jgi:ADP-ribose pyrophosphatase
MCVTTNFSSEPRVSRELLHKGSKFDFERLTFSGNAGTQITRECIRHPGSVIIAPIWQPAGGEAQLILIENWRLSNEQWMIELPAGTRTPGEDPALCAARELTEETGFIAGRLEPLCSFHTAPGLTDELMHAYVATSLTPAAQHLEDDERIRVLPTPLSQVVPLLSSGRITDAKTLLLLHLLDRLPPRWLSQAAS